MSRHDPPMDPRTDEATPEQLKAAREQGAAYGRALELMTESIAADGGETRAGSYLVGYAVEKAEGMYEWRDGQLAWHEPVEENVHVEVSVRDAGDGRFLPNARVGATLIDERGDQFGPHEVPLLWHPMLYHYGRNWTLPHSGEYTLRIHVEPPRFARHDEVNGCRFTEPADVEFSGVRVALGQD
jgi:hypothetical protein